MVAQCSYAAGRMFCRHWAHIFAHCSWLTAAAAAVACSDGVSCFVSVEWREITEQVPPPGE